MTDEIEKSERELPSKHRTEVDLREDWEELDPPDWITDLDREILSLLGESHLIITPAVIAKNIDHTRSSVSRRLNTLEAGQMVEKVERGHYRITKEGVSRMSEKIPIGSSQESEDNELWTRVGIPTPEQVEQLEEKGRLEW